ncbi:TPA: hypothetical protein N0F65_010492 [Lagenidium giganteum]|uniref:Major facilitator superfamily (MFS) profile domain-containing protein n=1 Tax=Lagenidium giganteum TaxID=4803 RepID=A0AAV2ZBA2_9STRA|nr:TPA: hypothetical protein N0F65_010492 [Lagenidium giganteum]
MSQRYIFLKMASSKDLREEGGPSMSYSSMLELKRLPSNKRRASSLHIGADMLTPRHMSIDAGALADATTRYHSNTIDVMSTASMHESLCEEHNGQEELDVLEEESVHELTAFDVPDGHYRLSKEFMFVVASFIVLVTSGGLILGFGPIYSVLVREDQWSELCGVDEDGIPNASDCAAQEVRLQYVFSTAFLCLSAANALFGVLLDIVGPRWTAIVGLLLSALGNFAMAMGDSHTGLGGWIIVGYSLLGVGGMGSYLAAFQILQLFEVQGFVCSTLSSLFNCSGYLYMLLQLPGITRQAFFQYYGIVVVGCIFVCFLLFPTNNVTKARDSLPIPAFRCEKPHFNTPKGIVDGMKIELKRPDLWYFAMYFGWISLIFAFAGGAIPSIIATLAGDDASAVSVYTNYLYPLLVNGTFIYSPVVGYVIDRYGFKVIFVACLVIVQLFVASLMVPLLHVQVVTFLLYAMAQACLYALQFAYIMICFPSALYGTLQAFMALVAFTFGLLNYFLTPLTQEYFAGDYTIVLFVLVAPTFLFYFFINAVQSCEDQIVQDEDERSKLII